jgi:AcrR family transcriptional regulator
MTDHQRRRQRLYPAKRRKQLLDVGLELLDREPSQAPSPRDVAERAEVAPGLLYRYFPDQRAFQLALLAESAQRFSAATRWPRLRFEEAMRASLQAQIQFAVRHAGLWRALRTAPAAIRERLQDDQVECVLRARGATPGSAQTRILLRGWLGFCDGAIEAWLDRREIEPGELVSLLASTLEPALAAIGTSTSSRPRSRKPRVRLLGAARPAAP